MRCGGCLKADEALHPSQEGRFPAIDFELFRIEFHGRKRRIGANRLVRSNVFGPQFQDAPAAVGTVGKTIDRQAQVRQHLVVDDIVQEHGIRVESILRQDDAIIE
jgi:hypothetical protein